MQNIELDRNNKLLYKNLKKIENQNNLTWNPLADKSGEMSDFNLNKRKNKQEEIEKANYDLFKKLQRINS